MRATAGDGTLGWFGIVRLGLVQTSLGAIVVLTTSTLNRVMVVELALPAMLPGALVAAHYFVQISRPRFGHGSDRGGRRTPWIIGGIALLGLGGTLAALATALMATASAAGIALAVLAFLLIGLGVGSAGTCLLTLLAALTHPRRRAAAATITWIMMIAGFAVTAGVVGHLLDPFSFTRLVTLSGAVAMLALIVAVAALWNLEGDSAVPAAAAAADEAPAVSFRAALRDVCSEAHTRRFAVFVFVSMLAYSAQDLVLEPFAGSVFGLTPGESTQLGGTQHGGVLLGMLLVAAFGSRRSANQPAAAGRVLRRLMISGCLASAALLALLAVAGFFTASWPLAATVFALGVANGVFAVAAIGSMMGLVSSGQQRRDGTRMGVWGAAQALAFGLGGIAGTFVVDLMRLLAGSPLVAYAVVFLLQAVMFACSARLAANLTRSAARSARPTAPRLPSRLETA